MKRICLITFLLITSCANTNATTYFSIRSQGTDAARELINDALYYPPPHSDAKKIEGNFVVTTQYTTSFNFDNIARSLFNPDLTTFNNREVIKITGSSLEDRQCKDWFADYFGLRRNFTSMLSFEPLLQNIIIDFDFLGNSPCWCPRLYWRLRTQVVHTWWDIAMREHNVQDSCTLSHPTGYFADLNIAYQDIADNVDFSGVPCRNLLCNFRAFASDRLVPHLVTPNNNSEFMPLWFGNISRQAEENTEFAELQPSLGWNAIENNCSHLGLEIRASIPTGNRPKARFLFEPIIGNGGHWELGAGINASYLIIQNECRDQSISIYGNVHITHLFTTKQTRSFDLCNGANSRYMLAIKMGQPVTNLLAGEEDGTDLAPPSKQFQGCFNPVINLTTFDVHVSVDWQLDCAFLFHWRWGHLNIELGYNYWKRSCEKISLTDCGTPLDSGDMWSLKGDAFVYGFIPDNNMFDEELRNMPIPLSTSQNCATIHAGTNRPIGAEPVSADARNPGVDNPAFSFFDANTPITYAPLIMSLNNTTQRTSKDPLCLNRSHINLASVATRSHSHKIFINAGHTWANGVCGLIPFLTIGGMIEFGPKIKCGKTTGLTCGLSSLSQIGIWLKSGFSF